MTETLIHGIQFLMVVSLVLLQLLTLYRIRGLYRKLNWWRNKALKTNNELKNLNAKMTKMRAEGGSDNELSNSENSPANAQ
jgi:hypothetical protein